MRNSPTYLLDTSALLAFYQDEKGAAAVEELFERRGRGDALICISHMTVFELIYLTVSRSSVDQAFSFLLTVRALCMEEIWPDGDLTWKAAQIQAEGGVSAADAFIAASALARGAVLVHKDPEFDHLKSMISQLKL